MIFCVCVCVFAFVCFYLCVCRVYVYVDVCVRLICHVCVSDFVFCVCVCVVAFVCVCFCVCRVCVYVDVCVRLICHICVSASVSTLSASLPSSMSASASAVSVSVCEVRMPSQVYGPCEVYKHKCILALGVHTPHTTPIVGVLGWVCLCVFTHTYTHTHTYIHTNRMALHVRRSHVSSTVDVLGCLCTCIYPHMPHVYIRTYECIDVRTHWQHACADPTFHKRLASLVPSPTGTNSRILKKSARY